MDLFERHMSRLHDPTDGVRGEGVQLGRECVWEWNVWVVCMWGGSVWGGREWNVRVGKVCVGRRQRHARDNSVTDTLD